ncbi:Putative Hac prophage II protein [Helicobacter pylori B38]|nr:Putative Hac prophage II protein [Helicobacter pylori B38]
MRKHGINLNDPIEELLKTTRKKLMLRESNYKKLKMMKRKKRYTFARVVRLVILEGIRKFQKENLFLNLQMQDFEIAISILEQKTKRRQKEGKKCRI